MKYVNAKDVLPAEILNEVQKYTCGALIYIPRQEEKKAAWGQVSGSKSQVSNRNVKIRREYRSGTNVHELMNNYCLSEASIRKIIYCKMAQAVGSE